MRKKRNSKYDVKELHQFAFSSLISLKKISNSDVKIFTVYSICNKQTYNFDILSRILHYHLVKYYNFYIKSHVYCKKFTRSIYIYIALAADLSQ